MSLKIILHEVIANNVCIIIGKQIVAGKGKGKGKGKMKTPMKAPQKKAAKKAKKGRDIIIIF